MTFQLIRMVSAVALMVSSTVAMAGTLSDKLSPEEMEAVLAGKQVVREKSVEGAPWPKTTVYQAVKATPEECAAVFFDFNNHKKIWKNLSTSRIVDNPSNPKNVKDVYYVLEVPLVKDEYYTVRDTLEKAGESYRISWTLLSARTTKRSEGKSTFEPIDADTTLMEYVNFVEPDGALAKLEIVKRKAKAQVLDGADNFVSATEQTKKDSSLMSSLIKVVQEALN